MFLQIIYLYSKILILTFYAIYNNLKMKRSYRSTESYYNSLDGPLPIKPNKRIIIDVDCGPDDSHAIIFFYYL